MLLTVGFLANARSADEYKIGNLLEWEHFFNANVWDYSNMKNKAVSGDDHFSPGDIATFDLSAYIKFAGSFTVPLNDLVTMSPKFENKLELGFNNVGAAGTDVEGLEITVPDGTGWQDVNDDDTRDATEELYIDGATLVIEDFSLTGNNLDQVMFADTFAIKNEFAIGDMFKTTPISETAITFRLGQITGASEKFLIENRIYIIDILELDVDPSWVIGWAPGANTNYNLGFKFAFLTKDYGKMADVIEKNGGERAPWVVGPVGIGLYLEQTFNFTYNPENWKDTCPGDSDSYLGPEGVFDTMTAFTQFEFAIDVLKNMERVSLVIGVMESFTATVPYSWNLEKTKTFQTHSQFGMELFLDMFVFGAYAWIETTDYYNSYSPEAGGAYDDNGNDDQGRGDNWWDQDAATIDGVTYAPHPQARGSVGPKLLIGMHKDWIETGIKWVGYTNFRAYDADKENYAFIDEDGDGVSDIPNWSDTTYMALQSTWTNHFEAYFKLRF